jgi:hypothetical protein
MKGTDTVTFDCIILVFYVVVLEYTADPPGAGTTFIRGEKRKDAQQELSPYQSILL